MQSSDKIYFPKLDGLRFLAFALVFIHHAPAISSCPIWAALKDYGWIGVDLFLCLSAFLFTRLLRTEFERTGLINITFFYVRRTLRIWPLYFFVSAALIGFTFYIDGYSDILLLRSFGLLTFTDNLLTAILDYSPIRYAGHLWTIAFEEQFYAVIPWALQRLFRMSQRGVLLALGSVLLVGLGTRAFLIGINAPYLSIWVLPVSHFDSILAGLVVGMGVLDPLLKRIPWLVGGLGGLMALIAVVILPSASLAQWSRMATYLLVGIGMGLILDGVMRASHKPILAWLSNRPLIFLGKISYGLYVYHLVSLRVGLAATQYLEIDAS